MAVFPFIVVTHRLLQRVPTNEGGKGKRERSGEHKDGTMEVGGRADGPGFTSLVGSRFTIAPTY